MHIRRLESRDRTPLAALLGQVENFTPDEVACALELVDLGAQGDHPDYQLRVAVEDDADRRTAQILGYICFGPTPMTTGTFDLYWVATAPPARGRGVGTRLVREMERELRNGGARIIRVETSANEAYGGTRGFYAALEYTEECRFRDFYQAGEDLVTLAKRLDKAP